MSFDCETIDDRLRALNADLLSGENLFKELNAMDCDGARTKCVLETISTTKPTEPIIEAIKSDGDAEATGEAVEAAVDDVETDVYHDNTPPSQSGGDLFSWMSEMDEKMTGLFKSLFD